MYMQYITNSNYALGGGGLHDFALMLTRSPQWEEFRIALRWNLIPSLESSCHTPIRKELLCRREGGHWVGNCSGQGNGEMNQEPDEAVCHALQ